MEGIGSRICGTEGRAAPPNYAGLGEGGRAVADRSIAAGILSRQVLPETLDRLPALRHFLEGSPRRLVRGCNGRRLRPGLVYLSADRHHLGTRPIQAVEEAVSEEHDVGVRH